MWKGHDIESGSSTTASQAAKNATSNAIVGHSVDLLEGAIATAIALN